MNYFKDFNNDKWLELNTSLEVRSLIRDIRKGSPSGPFLTFDISKLIFHHFKYLNANSHDEEMRGIITQATHHFRKGNVDEIFIDLKSKILDRE